MAGLDPQAADRAADTAGADDADRQLGAGGLRNGAPQPQRRRKGECAACAEQRTAEAVEGPMLGHPKPPHRSAGYYQGRSLSPNLDPTPQNCTFPDDDPVSQSFDLIINGRARSVSADEQATLLDVLRGDLGLRATRFGCGLEQCGACMVLIDGEPAYACSRLISTLPGRQVVTIEGLAADGSLAPLQQAFIVEQAGQCGFCLSGILISAKALLDRNPAPSRAEIAAALDHNLCRCGAHNRIIRAIRRAASARSGASA